MSVGVAVAVIDDHDAIHAAVRLWCLHATPPIAQLTGHLSWSEFLAAEVPEDAVVVFDLEQESGRPTFAGLEQVVARGHRVVVYSHLPASEVILRCLDIGAVTYLVKSEGRKHLIDAVRAACTNEPYVGPRMAGAMLSDQSSGRPSLAPREQQVLMAWFQTESKELVAAKLSIAPTTVRTHLQRVRAKYAAVGRPAPTKSALMARAIQDGILVVNDL
ncbi:MAG: LuxR C-terminal-related transcriptional regulator [Mycobacterium sp.]